MNVLHVTVPHILLGRRKIVEGVLEPERRLSLSTWTPAVMTVLWWSIVLDPVMLLFWPSLPGRTPNLGLRQPGLVCSKSILIWAKLPVLGQLYTFGCLGLGIGPDGHPGEDFNFLRGRYL